MNRGVFLGRLASAAFVSLVLVLPFASSAEPDPAQEVVGDPDFPWFDNQYYKFHLQIRPRIELAKIDGSDSSQAYTIRSHVGFGTKSWEGFSTYVELENVWSVDDSSYNDGTETSSSDTIIADPETTELNQAWLQFERDDLLQKLVGGDAPEVKVGAKAGIQAVIFDDARFIGNVDWRQNEQTIGAAIGSTDFGVDGLMAQYGYLWDIFRIFGDKGGPSTSDYNSDSHVAHLHYTGFESVQISAFGYFLDFEADSPANSSNTYGVRLTGGCTFDDTWSLKYAGSYAFQTDAARNPMDYDAHYAWVGADIVHSDYGSAGAAYERLGSDDGNKQFVTPLATAHKFNGFADAFLDNGGPRGLQDLQIRVSPNLPWDFKGTLIYHEFFRADGGQNLGSEFDGVLTRRFNQYLTGLAKFAWFEGRDRGPNDRWRLWFQVEFEY
jgi:hypothetical protein